MSLLRALFLKQRASCSVKKKICGISRVRRRIDWLNCVFVAPLSSAARCVPSAASQTPQENGLLRKEEEEEGRAVITAAFLPITEHHQTSLWVFGGGLPPPPPFPSPRCLVICQENLLSPRRKREGERISLAVFFSLLRVNDHLHQNR